LSHRTTPYWIVAVWVPLVVVGALVLAIAIVNHEAPCSSCPGGDFASFFMVFVTAVFFTWTILPTLAVVALLEIPSQDLSKHQTVVAAVGPLAMVGLYLFMLLA
jgi:hypothetical protein